MPTYAIKFIIQPGTKKIKVVVRISSQTVVIMSKIWLIYDKKYDEIMTHKSAFCSLQ